MKQHAYVSLMAFILLTIANIMIGLFVFDWPMELMMERVMEAVPLHIAFVFMYFLIANIRISIPTSLRPPMVRFIFWTLIVIYGITMDTRMVTEDALYDLTQSFFFGWTAILFELRAVGIIKGPILEIFLIFLFGASAYQALILLFSEGIYRRWLKKKPKQS